MAAKKKTTAVRNAKATATVSIQSTAVSPESAGARKLPRGTVALSGENKLVISVEKLSRSLIRDQRARLVSSMGCVSNPGGPGC